MTQSNQQDSGGRVHVFIDAANLWSVQKSKKKSLDYSKLLKAFSAIYQSEHITVYYYEAYPANGTRSYSLDGKHKFFTFLSKGLKFIVRKKPLKQIAILEGDNQLIQEKGNMDVEMTIDAVHFRDQYDTVVFMTGDSDFLALVDYLLSAGKKVHILSSRRSVSKELRTGSHGYLDILSIKDDIWGKALRRRQQ